MVVHQRARSAAYNFVYAARVVRRSTPTFSVDAIEALVRRHPRLLVMFENVGRKVFNRIGETARPRTVRFVDATSRALGRADRRDPRGVRLLLRPREGPGAADCASSCPKGEAVLSMASITSSPTSVDGRSSAIYLAVLYLAGMERREAALPPLTARYGDFVRGNREDRRPRGPQGLGVLAGDPLGRARRSWNCRRTAPAPRSIPTAAMPTSGRRPPSSPGGSARWPGRQKATLFNVLLAAFQVLLHRHSARRTSSWAPHGGRPARVGGPRRVLPQPVAAPGRIEPATRSPGSCAGPHYLSGLEHEDYPFP